MLRIKGVVKIAERVRETLREGVPADEVDGFREFVLRSVAQVEHICERAGVAPERLPTPTRKAYQFLKGIDLDDLPVAGEQTSRPRRAVGIKNVVNNKRAALRAIARWAASDEPDEGEPARIAEQLRRSVAQIEGICERQGGSPAEMPGPSRSAYALMKLLTTESNFETHLKATRRATAMARDLVRKHYGDDFQAVVEFENMSNTWQCRTRGSTVMARIDEGFIRAGDDVLEAILRSMLVRKTRKRGQLIHEFAMSEEYTDVVLELDLAAEVGAERSAGIAYDLDELFDAVNRAYFGDRMSRPRCCWTRRLTRRSFGHYEPTRDRVVLSATLDDGKVPRFVVEYLLYHELLHRQHPGRWVNGRYRCHTPEFRREERKFARRAEAEQWLAKLAAS